MANTEHAFDQIPAGVDHETIYGRVDTSTRRTWQAEGRRSRQEIHARRSRGLGQDDDLSCPDALSGNSKLHELSGLPVFGTIRHDTGKTRRALPRQTAGVRAR